MRGSRTGPKRVQNWQKKSPERGVKPLVPCLGNRSETIASNTGFMPWKSPRGTDSRKGVLLARSVLRRFGRFHGSDRWREAGRCPETGRARAMLCRRTRFEVRWPTWSCTRSIRGCDAASVMPMCACVIVPFRTTRVLRTWSRSPSNLNIGRPSGSERESCKRTGASRWHSVSWLEGPRTRNLMSA